MAYQGVIAPILAGQGGYNGSENYDAVPYTDLLDARNVRFDGDAWRKVGGLTLLDANAVTGAPNCVAGIDYWSDTTMQQQITVWDNGIAYKEVSGNLDAVELGNTLTVTTSPPVLLACGQEVSSGSRKLLLFSQGQQPQVVNAAANTFSNCTAHAADWSGSNWPMAGVVHDRRVYAWGNPAAPHAIYASAIDDHTNFLYFTAGVAESGYLPSFDINPGEGHEIRACYSIGSTRLYVFKYPHGIYFVDTSDITSYFTPVTTVRSDIGIAGPKAITKVGSLGTWFIASDGHIYSLEMLNDPNVDLQDACITAKMNLNNFIKTFLRLSRLKFAQLIWDSSRQELSAYYCTTASTINNVGIIINLRNPQNPRISIEDRGAYFNAAWTRLNSSRYNDIIVSGTGGFAYLSNQTARSIGASTGYTAALRTADTDFSWTNQAYAAYTKRFDWLEIIYNATFNADVFIDTYLDGQYYNTYSTSMSSGGGQLGSFILGTDTLGAIGQLSAKIKIGGIGKRFGLKLRNADSQADFSISRLLIHFVPQETGGETAAA